MNPLGTTLRAETHTDPTVPPLPEEDGAFMRTWLLHPSSLLLCRCGSGVVLKGVVGGCVAVEFCNGCLCKSWWHWLVSVICVSTLFATEVHALDVRSLLSICSVKEMDEVDGVVSC